jgi:hypothetical protein
MTASTLAKLATVATASLLCIACSTAPSRSKEADAKPAANNAAPSQDGKRIVKSRDGSFEGEIIGTPAPDSKFAKLEIGMDMNQIQDVMGRTPDRSHSYESGKRWIPFYFGNDARRMQVLYKGEGCLVVTNGNVWGAAGGDLIQIEVDPKGACYQP